MISRYRTNATTKNVMYNKRGNYHFTNMPSNEIWSHSRISRPATTQICNRGTPHPIADPRPTAAEDNVLPCTHSTSEDALPNAQRLRYKMNELAAASIAKRDIPTNLTATYTSRINVIKSLGQPVLEIALWLRARLSTLPVIQAVRIV